MQSEAEIREALNQVKRYINDKNYEQARALLKKINHPKREQWLAQLETAAHKHTIDKLPKPWNPYGIVNLSFFITPIIASFILAWNWRRLGKGWWGIPTALVQIGTVTLLILSIFIAYPLISQSDGNKPSNTYMITSLFMFLASINLFFPFFIANRQAGAYKLFNEKGRDAILSYDYQWGRNLFFLIGFIILFVGGVLGYFYYTQLPKQFDDEWVSFTYEGSWREENSSQYANCQSENLTCRAVVSNGSNYSPVVITIASMDMPDNFQRSEELADLFWQYLYTSGNFTTIDRGGFVVNAMDAYYISYTGVSEGTEFYLTDLIVAQNGTDLYINILAYSKETMDDNWPEIQAILDTIVLSN